MLKNYLSLFLLTLFATTFYSCKNDPFKIPTDLIDVNLNFKRFEQDFFALKEKTQDDSIFKNGLKQLEESYGQFFYDWLMMPELMGIGHPDSTSTHEVLKAILNSSSYQYLMQMVNSDFADFSSFEKEFHKAYQRFQYYFPEKEIPQIVTYVSNFSLTMNPVGRGYIGISLDMHMGDTFGFYKMVNPPFENYWMKLLNPETILPLHFIAHGADVFGQTNQGMKFSDEMFFWGKLLYFVEAMMPHIPKHLIIGYTPEEYQICINEEKDIWSYFVKDDILFSTDKKRYMRYFTEGPHTVAPGVPENTPPMLGKFCGWQVVKSYMKKNPDFSLSELMELEDADTFLRKVKYKP